MTKMFFTVLIICGSLFADMVIIDEGMDQEQKALQKEREKVYRTPVEDEELYNKETAPKDPERDRDFLLHDHPLEHHPLQEGD